LKDAKNCLNYKKTIWVAVVKDGEAKEAKVITETKDFMATITEAVVVTIITVVMMVVVEEVTEEDQEVVNVVVMTTDRSTMMQRRTT
jgi:hypothetical protein